MRRRPSSGALVLAATRAGIPLLIATAGAILIAVGHAGVNNPTAVTGLVLLGVAVIVWSLNLMFRLSVSSNQDREREEEARRFFDRHGRWPDEPDEPDEPDG
jgi:hypothetical protein